MRQVTLNTRQEFDVLLVEKLNQAIEDVLMDLTEEELASFVPGSAAKVHSLALERGELCKRCYELGPECECEPRATYGIARRVYGKEGWKFESFFEHGAPDFVAQLQVAVEQAVTSCSHSELSGL